MGVNDVGNTFWLADVETNLGKSVERYFEQMQILYDAGARQFVVLTVPRKSPRVLCHEVASCVVVLSLTILKPRTRRLFCWATMTGPESVCSPP